MTPEPIWVGGAGITSMLVQLSWRLVVTPSDDAAVATTYWCEGFLTIGNCDEMATPSWSFRARTLDQAIAMLLDQVEIERDVAEYITGSRA